MTPVPTNARSGLMDALIVAVGRWEDIRDQVFDSR